jgi:hypothetical protein
MMGAARCALRTDEYSVSAGRLRMAAHSTVSPHRWQRPSFGGVELLPDSFDTALAPRGA